MTANITDSDREFVKNVVLDGVVFSVDTWHVSDSLGGLVTTHYARFGDILGYGDTKEKAESCLVSKVIDSCRNQKK